ELEYGVPLCSVTFGNIAIAGGSDCYENIVPAFFQQFTNDSELLNMPLVSETFGIAISGGRLLLIEHCLVGQIAY
ncbi:hypothetical protein AVEN_66875-1, partial [Araneus ventricosus]